jgi:pimeloyl-ACP methyl ester carboxylesterase
MNEGFVDLGGVRTWYGETGQGPPLVLVYPGGVDSRVFAPNVEALAARGPRLTRDDLAPIRCRTLAITGDDDEMPHEHTVELYRSLPNSELAIVPGTSHGFLVEKPDLCNALLLDFLVRDPVRTFAPIRRA